MPPKKTVWQWATLTALSASLAWVLHTAGFPAALLLGPMLAGVILGMCGVAIRTPGWAFAGAQAIIGCVVARAITPSIVVSITQDWAVMLLVVTATLAAGGLTGWVLVKYGALPGNTAAWGTSPGGAAAMTAMADAYGADVRLVAFMQYLRVFIVVLTASAVSRLLSAAPMAAPGLTIPVFDPGFDAPVVPLLQTLAIALAGMVAGRAFRIPAGAMLVPMIAGTLFNTTGTVLLTVPPWLLACAYAALGWYIGLRFTRDVVRHAFRAIPQLLLATLLLMGLCGGSAWMLCAHLHIDALTAYLSTSPGGLDSIAIIALGSNADIPFIMALQTLRLFAVILTGPHIARLVCRLS